MDVRQLDRLRGRGHGNHRRAGVAFAFHGGVVTLLIFLAMAVVAVMRQVFRGGL